MKSEITLLDLIEAWRRSIRDYVALPENRITIDNLAIDHWQVFWRLFVACLPAEQEDDAMKRLIMEWKARQVQQLRKELLESIGDEKEAWRVFSSLLAEARGHTDKAKPVQGLSVTIKRQRNSSAISLDSTAVAIIDDDVVDWLQEESPDGREPFWYSDPDGHTHIGLTPLPPPPVQVPLDEAPTVPPPARSGFTLRKGVLPPPDEDDKSGTG